MKEQMRKYVKEYNILLNKLEQMTPSKKVFENLVRLKLLKKKLQTHIKNSISLENEFKNLNKEI